MRALMIVTAEHSTSITELTFVGIGPAEAGSRRLRDDLLETWVAVTEAGGAVGFTTPSSASTGDRRPGVSGGLMTCL
jgi:hypothetical protein